MVELNIWFDHNTTLEDAADALRSEMSLRNNYIENRRLKLNENCMVVASEWED